MLVRAPQGSNLVEPMADPAHPYLRTLTERVVVFDGGTGTWLQEQGLTADDFGGPDLEGCNEILVETRPDVIRRLHAAYFDAGADAVESNTFGSFGVPLGEYGLADRTRELNRLAAGIAREAADEAATADLAQ